MSMLEIAEKRGNVQSHLDFLGSAYSHILNKPPRRMYTGAEYAEAIRENYCGPEAELYADLSEKYVISISVRADGATEMKYRKP